MISKFKKYSSMSNMYLIIFSWNIFIIEIYIYKSQVASRGLCGYAQRETRTSRLNVKKKTIRFTCSFTFLRREGLGGHYIAGRSPTLEEEPSCDNLDVDEGFFERNIWPEIAHRVKSFENLKVSKSRIRPRQSTWKILKIQNTKSRNNMQVFVFYVFLSHLSKSTSEMYRRH